MSEKPDLVPGKKICDKCGKTIEKKHFDICPDCGGSAIGPVGLFPCPDCGKDISMKAAICVNCGRLLRPNYGEKIYTLLKWVVIVSAVSGIIWGIWYGYHWNKIWRY